ncbi:low-affinity Cu transporter [Lachancea thermotolerans CBS 6340]|uniref:Copper transport protein n=1 Tax=Lachancea thermotolerans (strain ATCC 56472 / CBS 6340 / NRRL Y-8284) TaxID=559295 RepID=C5DD60_LACTC|nr:KLTH0B08536p [Lachancea thermotolerans CBS 6340]CAR21721.1 KLTH0B08536p [Lachancea thermotolerans CBS 6340]
MEHSMMDHGDMGHGDMGHDDMCSMNMLFTWNYKNTCVVFKWWHIRTLPHLLLSMIVVAASAYLYEYMKYYSAKSTASRAAGAANLSHTKAAKMKSASWYGAQVGFSFMLMLVFMTFNGWLMLAVVAGAAWGHYSWGHLTEGLAHNSLACH